MVAELTEGETYTVRATITNMSTKAGAPVAAVLTINVAGVVDSQTILDDSAVYGFAAGQTHTFEFPMAVPIGAGGKTGAIVAEVLDPNGNKLADDSLDISIAALGPPSGEILEIEWKRYTGTDVWHPISSPMPEGRTITHRFGIRNTGAMVASFKIGFYLYSDWHYSEPVDISPGEGYIEWTFGSGKVEVITVTFHLFADDIEVDSKTVTVTKV